MRPENKQGLDVVAPIAEIAAERLFGASWSNPLSVAIGLMLLSTLSAYLLLGPRVLYAMAQAGQFPADRRPARRPRAGHPRGGHAPPGRRHARPALDRLVREHRLYASVGLSIFSMLAMSSIFILRRKRPDLPRPFRTPGYPVTPASTSSSRRC